MMRWAFKAARWLSEKTRPNPYRYYRWLRAIRRMLWIPPRFWLVTGYQEADAILRDRRFAKPAPLFDAPGKAEPTPQRARLSKIADRVLLFLNPPDHTRIRALMTHAFSAKAINSLRPRIQQICDHLLDNAATRGTADLIADFAYPLPVTVIAEMLGVPTSDRDQFRRWSRHIVRMTEPIDDPKILDDVVSAAYELRDYFAALVAERRRHPGDDMLSRLTAAEEKGDRLNQDELLANLTLLLIAGHETTTSLIGNGTLALLRNPEQLGKLRSQPSLIDTAIEELLRYETPFQAIGLNARETVQINGRTIKRGEEVAVIVGAANRDPIRFPNPDRLDISRKHNDHLAFGGGIHHCLGANLARLEGQIAIATLLRRSPKLALVEERPQWRDNLNLRSLEALRVAL